MNSGFYEQALQTAPDGFIVVDAEGIIHFVNRQAEILFGWTRDELVGQPMETLVPDRVRHRHPKHRGAYFAAPVTRPMAANLELSARRKDGSEFPVDISLSPLQTEEGLWVSAAIRDASNRKANEIELRSAYERVTATVEEMERQRQELALVSEMGDMLQSCLRAEEAYEIIAAAAAKLFSTTSGVVYRPTAAQSQLESVAVWGAAHAYQRAIIAEDCWALRRGRMHRRVGNQAAYGCRHSSDTATGWSLCVPLLAHGELLGLFHLEPGPDDPTDDPQSHLADVERLTITVAEHLSLALANLKLRENLRIQSERDALTGLYNRRHLDAALDQAVARASRDGEELAMLLLDVDDFKRVNDTLSHIQGDSCLRTVARILLGMTRGDDIACRYGGDEFAIILPRMTVAAATERAERIRALIAQETDVTVSIGVSAITPGQGLNGDDLLRACDSFLRYAKSNGKNQVAGPGSDAPNRLLQRVTVQ